MVWSLRSALVVMMLWAGACHAPAAGDPVSRAEEVSRRVPSSQAEVQVSFAPLVKAAAPAVVNIYTRRVVQSRVSPLFSDPFFRRFFGDMGLPEGQRRQIQNALGSGVIVGEDGLIVTNVHVVEGADEVTVVLADRREFEAEIVLTDPRTDLALLRIDSSGQSLPVLPLGDSDALEVGDLVLAIGNPFGVGQTVTSGIVSATARSGVGINQQGVFIQTDAAINPGNSGGALIDMQGRLVGVPSAILSRSGGSHGIGFAIPSDLVRATIGMGASAVGGRTVRPWIGGTGQPVTQDIAHSLRLDRPRGVLLSEVYPRGPLDRAGLKVGDVVLSVHGYEVDDPASLHFRVSTQPPGAALDLRFWRDGGIHSTQLTVELPPEDPPRNATSITGRNPLDGATIANLSPALVEELSLDGPRQGVVVLSVGRGSVADRFGFESGDVVLSINGREVSRVDEVERVLRVRSQGWRLTIRRGGRVMNLQVG